MTRNREALLRLVAMMFAAAGLVQGKAVLVLPRGVRLSILRALRPAESALRRLIFIEAKDLNIAAPAARPAPTKPIPRGVASDRLPSFPLFDPRMRFAAPRPRHPAGHGPRMFFFDGSDPVIEPVAEAPALSPDDPVSAARLCRRLQVLQRALDTLPTQARRLARAAARRASAAQRPVLPMRPGRPPGYRAKPQHEVDTILSDCHALALYALRPPDT